MLVQQHRGQFIETRHRVRAVAVVDGHITWSSGPPSHSPWRSAGKPFQLLCSLAALGVCAADLPIEWLAIGASSHSGEEEHLGIVQDILDHFGVAHSGLRCGAEPPAHRPTAEALIRDECAATPMHNDCSGKHAFMLAATMHRGWDPDYRPVAHPLQVQVIDAVQAQTMEQPGIAVDGCGVPTFHLTIAGMARAWSRLASAMALQPDDGLGRIGWAMAQHPHLVSGTDRIDAAIACAARQPFVGKIGALGVFCVALPERNMGIALKIESGDEAALACAVPAVIAQAAPGAISIPEDWPWRTVRNVVGNRVGQRVVVSEPNA